MARPEATLHRLCCNEGIGFTIAMALMCFLSGGRLPIYDRFAHLALAAILWDRQPGDVIAEGGLVLSDLAGKSETRP